MFFILVLSQIKLIHVERDNKLNSKPLKPNKNSNMVVTFLQRFVGHRQKLCRTKTPANQNHGVELRMFKKEILQRIKKKKPFDYH